MDEQEIILELKLNARNVKFCQEYSVHGNGGKAAIAAGYAPDSARITASKLLTNANIKSYIKALQAENLKAAKITRDRIANEFAKIAFLNPKKAYDVNSKLKPIQEMDNDTAAAISGIDVEELWERGEEGMEQTGVTKKIKFVGKIQALENLAKMGGFYAPDKVAQTDTDGNNVSAAPTINVYTSDAPPLSGSEEAVDV